MSREMAPSHPDFRSRPSYSAKLLGSKWTILIVRELAGGPKRFSHLQAALPGISPRTLAERLRWLEAEDILSRATFAEVPPRVEYTLTAKGQGLRPVLLAMRNYEVNWGPV